MSRYDLTDFEWRVIEPLLPNKPRGVPRVDDRRVLNGIFWVLRSGAPWRDLPRALWSAHDLLQPLRAMAKGGRVGPADGRHHRRARRRRPNTCLGARGLGHSGCTSRQRHVLGLPLCASLGRLVVDPLRGGRHGYDCWACRIGYFRLGHSICGVSSTDLRLVRHRLRHRNTGNRFSSSRNSAAR
jgi:transposase